MVERLAGDAASLGYSAARSMQAGQLTPDGRGYFGYNGQLKLYFEVISYEKLIGDALRRNRMLFKKLGLPTDRLGDD